MKRVLAACLLVMASLAVMSLHAKQEAADTALYQVAMDKLRPLHKPVPKPGPSDWLANHKEAGQSFAQYVRSDPVTAKGERNVLYIQPIGTFSPTQRSIVTLTAEYMGHFFGVKVKTNKTISGTAIPATARRAGNQILTTYVLDSVLKPALPKDAAAMLALTAADLWPGEGWNFVFGQASLRDRVGVWSMYRNGNPDRSAASFKLCLLRTIKIAVHETGHMFSIVHCTAYACCMNGSNHRDESDRQPVYLCPECVAKVCWATGTDLVARYEKLTAFCWRNGFETERGFFEASMVRLKD